MLWKEKAINSGSVVEGASPGEELEGGKTFVVAHLSVLQSWEFIVRI